MNLWQKITVIVVVAAFPGGLAFMRTADKRRTSSLFKDAEAAIHAKAAELSHMDIKIMTAQGELLKYQGRHNDIVGELSTLRSKIDRIIEAATKPKAGPPRAQGKPRLNPM